jgi:benzoate membrane transport protein
MTDSAASRAPSVQALVAGALAAFVGFASSFAVVVKGLLAVGATPEQAASGLAALSVAMGLGAVILSFRTRMPISVAWSTPGAALLATTGTVPGGFEAAVGAFLVTGALIVIAGLWRPLGKLVERIPPAIASAMLAGVLLGLCLAPVRAVAAMPLLALPVVVVWAVMARINRLYAVPAAVAVTIGLLAFTGGLAGQGEATILSQPLLVTPTLTLPALIGIALPLFIVTMASQNIPGLAVLNVNGYRPDAGPLFRVTGLLTMLAAPFGAHAVNLAAITAAMCASEEADPDPARRWWAAAVSGVLYIAFGLVAGAAIALISRSPPVLIEAVAGLALLGSFGGALSVALADPKSREAALVTFLVTASGLTFAGIGGAFWGLLAGGAMHALARWRA